MTTYVNIFGLYMSGKTALHDALCTYKNCYSISPHFDLDLIRLPGGLNDLLVSFQAFSEHHQAIAIERFLELLNACGNYNGIFDKKTQQKLCYGEIFRGFPSFKNKAEQYLMSDGHYCNHPHSYIYESRLQNFSRRTKSKIFNIRPDNCFISHRSYEDVRLFFQEGIDCLLQTANGYGGQEVYVLNNLNFVESIGLSGKIFPNIRQIAVIRNPLDVLTDLHTKNPVHNYNPDVSIKINNANHPIKFLLGYNKKLEAIKKYAAHSSDLLVIRFEDLVHKYFDTLIRINQYIGNHLQPNEYEKPLESSQKNIGIWKDSLEGLDLYRQMGVLPLSATSYYYPELF